MWDLLGEARRACRCASSCGFGRAADHLDRRLLRRGKTLLDLAKEMEQLRLWGMGGWVKVGGLSPEQDAERVSNGARRRGPAS